LEWPSWTQTSDLPARNDEDESAPRHVGHFLGHIALPAKITIQVLEPIDLHERFGPNPRVDKIYNTITQLMQQTPDELPAQRHLPVIG
jgi:hypothetical protein